MSADSDPDGDGDGTEAAAPDGDEQLRIGFEPPSHLFTYDGTDCLCGNPRERSGLSPGAVCDFTTPLGEAQSQLDSRVSVVAFADGVCGNCLRAYYNGRGARNQLFDVYAEEIATDDPATTFGFCKLCNEPVDVTRRHNTAEMGGQYPIVVCDPCCLRTWVNIMDSMSNLDERNRETYGDTLANAKDRLAEYDDIEGDDS